MSTPILVDESRFPYIGQPGHTKNDIHDQEHYSWRVDMDKVGSVIVISSHYLDNDLWWWTWHWEGDDGQQPKGCRYSHANTNPICPSMESVRDVARADAVEDYLNRKP